VRDRFEELCKRAKLAFTEGDADRSVELYKTAVCFSVKHRPTSSALFAYSSLCHFQAP